MSSSQHNFGSNGSVGQCQKVLEGHVLRTILLQEKAKAQQLLDDVEDPNSSVARSVTLSVTITGCHGVGARKKGQCALIRNPVTQCIPQAPCLPPMLYTSSIIMKTMLPI